MAAFDRPQINVTFRVWIALSVCFLCLFTLVLRLWFLQIIKGEFFRDRSENNRLRTINIPSPRGLIMDRNGEVLVRNRPSFNIDLVVEDSADPRKTVSDLAEIVGASPDELYDRLTKQNRRRRFEPKQLLKDISRDLVGKIAAQRHRLPGVIINVVPSREYIYGDLAAHAIGYIREITGDQLNSRTYTGYRSGDVIGQYGLEAKLEPYLKGERGTQAVIVNAMGNKIGEAFLQPEIPGHNVTLTIDRRLQEVADKALGSRPGAVVALDPRNGEILAMTSSPRFDPNMFTTEISKEAWADLGKDNKLSNRVIQGAYPPGSVFKIFMAIASLAEGVISTAERTFCPGFLQFGRRAFKCHKHSGHGSTDMYEAIVQSCDVYFYTVGQRLGIDRIHQYAKMFGLGEPTQLDLAEENPGLIPSTKWKETYFRNPEDKRWYPGETLPVAIGQGAVTTTPLQIARAMAAAVNGGKLLRPRIVRQVVARDGHNVLEESAAEPEVLSTLDIEPGQKTAILDHVRKAMVGVVQDRRGTGHKAAMPAASGIQVGGKTGTAQVASRESGSKDNDHAWFAGYAPADNPQIVVVAIVENGGHGGATAAPVVHDVMAAFFHLDEPQTDPSTEGGRVED